MKKKKNELCPLCKIPYSRRRQKTHHHVYPKTWYGGEGVQVEMCSVCHQVEFNKQYLMDHVWSREECLRNLVQFCAKKKKNAFKVYPQLLDGLEY